jgi:hypothetical protein
LVVPLPHDVADLVGMTLIVETCHPYASAERVGRADATPRARTVTCRR